MAISKRQKAIRERVPQGLTCGIDEALQTLKDVSRTRFNESVDVAVILGVDPRKSDQNVRGATVLPHGTGKSVRVAVFARGEQAESARQAGADIVGLDDLAEQVKAGQMDFDVVIAAPDTMAVVGRLGQILGPRGLMPNPKVGTVTADVAGAVRNAKAGQVRYRADKGGIVHATIGKISFEIAALRENLQTLLTDLRRMKPATAKGIYFKKVSVSSTMGPGIVVERTTLDLG
ncbi:MAG TPA: 50S ribosomal protein L1 [Gammaproteobacteria bacterium]|nr:50S ribosomal protein L1 [Gammaproteobacteria bacterium]